MESPQYIIRAMGGSGHAVIDVWNIEWHLPDKHIIDIRIDPGTNLPLIHEFVCTSAQKQKYGPDHADNDEVFREQDVASKTDHMYQYELKNPYYVTRLWQTRQIRISVVLRRSCCIGIRICASICKVSNI